MNVLLLFLCVLQCGYMQLEKGFYYHYKRDPNTPCNVNAYEVVGTAWSTESGGSVHTSNPEDFVKDEVVIYRPLYDSALVYMNGKRFWMRPLDMFLEEITKDGKTFLRFQKITDPEIIGQLEKIKTRMYRE